MDDPSETRRQFEREARGPRTSLVSDLWTFLRYNKKWWLLPILVAMLLLGLLVILSGTPLAPFIYPLF